MVPHCNVNLQMGCEDCRFADSRGLGCTHGLLSPILALMAGRERCPNFKGKTKEQIEEQLKMKEA